MIRIRTDQIRDTIADLREELLQIASLREEADRILLRMGDGADTLEARTHLQTMISRLDEAISSLGQLSDALDRVCDAAEAAEKAVIGRYETERLSGGTFVVGRTRVNLNPRLEKIARITWDTEEAG